MKVQVESVSPVKKKLSISVPEEAVLQEFDDAYKELNKKAQVPGFRKGKVPRTILEKMFAGSVESQVYENLVRNTIVQALQENELDAVAMPEITEPKREGGKGFSYIASIEVKPKIDLKDYKGVKVAKPSSEVSADQVKEVLSKVQDAHAVLKPREGATHPVKGDYVSLLIQGIDDEGNLTAPDAEPKEQLYEIGGGILHEAVEKAAMKLGINESAPVTIETKAEDKKDFHVRVTLKEIKEKILPSLDDEFAKSAGPFENLAALKSRIEEDLKKEVEANARGQMVEEILKSIVEKNPVDLPHSLVDHELHQMINAFWQQLERSGFKEIPEEYSEEKLHEKMEPDAKRRVHEQLMIEAIAKAEKIDVTDEELGGRIADLARSAKVPVAEFRSYYEKTNRLDGIRFQILAQKTVDFLLANASIK
jgi:trigger factor